MNTVLSIAGSDCSGGAGIQADLKTMIMNGVYGMSAISALTAQNTTGVDKILEVPPEFLKKQLDMIFTDIFPDAVKIGMTASSQLIEVIAERLSFYGAKNIVVDPVMVATSGSRLMESEAILSLKNRLFPLAAVITPNIPEAEVLSGIDVYKRQQPTTFWVLMPAVIDGVRSFAAITVPAGRDAISTDSTPISTFRCV